MLVETHIGDQLLQLPVLIFKLLHPPQLAHAKPAAILLPVIERLLRNAHPADRLRHRHARLRLLQREGNLLISLPRLLHLQLLAHGRHRAGKLSLKTAEKTVGTSSRVKPNQHYRDLFLSNLQAVLSAILDASETRGYRCAKSSRQIVIAPHHSLNMFAASAARAVAGMPSATPL